MKPQQFRTRSLLILFGLTFIACGLARAQGANAQTPATATQTPIPAPIQATAQQASAPVRLNVLVADKSNRGVFDLRQEDFRVEENGEPQAITHFAREQSPVSYTLVVDNTGSLKDMLDLILSACGALVSANRPDDETSVVRFVGAKQITVPQDFTGEQPRLIRALENMYVEGGLTAVIDAVYLSAERVAERRTDEAGRRRALVLLTDGEDRASRRKQSELRELLRKLDVQVFAIGFTANLDKEGGMIRKSPRDIATAFLNSLTQETGGRAFFPKNVKELEDAVNEIARDLRTQYVINYQSTNTNHDGKFRKVQVELSGAAAEGKRTVHTRTGYFAPGAKGAAKK